MKLTLRSITILTTMLIAIISASCSPSGNVAPISTPEPTNFATAASTAITTVTPSPVPTATSIFSEERTTKLNQQFQDFLNKKDAFTPEKISTRMIETISSLDKSEVGLGFANGQRIECYLFDYFEQESRVFLVVGFDGADGGRFITLLEITLYMYEAVETSIFFVDKLYENNILSQTGETFDYGDRNSLLPFLDSLRNRVISVFLYQSIIDESCASGLDIAAEDYLNEANPKIALSFGLFHLVTSNGFDVPEMIGSDSSSIIRIYSVDQIKNMDASKVPIIDSIQYFAGILG